MNYKKKSVLVVDNGLFLHFAETLTESFGVVYYWSPWVCAFPKSDALMVGQGVPGVTRVRDIWEVADEVDLFLFFDVGYGAMQVYLAAQGKRVWGPREGEALELDRVFAKDKAKELGIKVGPYEVVTGIDALRKYLQDNPDQYVKMSTLRGDGETFYAQDYQLIEPRLDHLSYILGAKKNWIDFIVEDAIPDAIEIGYDGYTIDGLFARNAFFGVEVKDKGYLGEALAYNELPASLQEVNEKLSPYFAQTNYRGIFSSEVRVQGSRAYLLDPCCRMPSPPGELYGVMISNWADILWQGAEGVLVEPIFTAKFGAILVLMSEWAMSHWQAVTYPDAIADFVRLKNYCVVDDMRYVVPQLHCPIDIIGYVTATGDTAADAIRKVRRNAEQVEGLGITYVTSALDDALEVYEEAKGS